MSKNFLCTNKVNILAKMVLSDPRQCRIHGVGVLAGYSLGYAQRISFLKVFTHLILTIVESLENIHEGAALSYLRRRNP